MQAWLRSGEFSSKARMWDSIKANIIYYSIIGLVGVPFLIYIVIVLKYDTW